MIDETLQSLGYRKKDNIYGQYLVIKHSKPYLCALLRL